MILSLSTSSANLLVTQLFTLLTSTVGAVMTVVYALDDLVATPLRRHLFDCSNVFRPALAVGAAFWSILVRAHYGDGFKVENASLGTLVPVLFVDASW